MRCAVILLSLFLWGCSVDEFPPCSSEGPAQSKCKEYQYVFGKYNSSNEYVYNEKDQPVLILTKKSNGVLEGETSIDYSDSDKVVSIEKKNSNGKLVLTETYDYNNDGKLISKKTAGDKVRAIVFSYQANKLIARTRKTNSVITSIDSLEYYTGTDDLFRTLTYENGNVTGITYFEVFSNNTEKERTYNNAGVLQKELVRSFNGQNLLKELIEYSSNGSIEKRSVYDYKNDSLQEILRYDFSGTEYERIEVQRF